MGNSPPKFGRSVNPISTKGADYAHQNTTPPSPLRFSYLPPSLPWTIITINAMVRRTAKMNIGKKQANATTYTSVFIQLTDMGDDGRVNIDVPRYDQSKYWGRATHMAVITNPLNLFATPAALNHSKDIVTRHKKVFYMILCYV